MLLREATPALILTLASAAPAFLLTSSSFGEPSSPSTIASSRAVVAAEHEQRVVLVEGRHEGSAKCRLREAQVAGDRAGAVLALHDDRKRRCARAERVAARREEAAPPRRPAHVRRVRRIEAAVPWQSSPKQPKLK